MTAACAGPRATVSYCDAHEEDGEEPVLVILCCEAHGREVQSVCGSNVEFPNDGTPYALVCGSDLDTVTKALEESGVEGMDVTEGS